jgi:hypothetical protein
MESVRKMLDEQRRGFQTTLFSKEEMDGELSDEVDVMYEDDTPAGH